MTTSEGLTISQAAKRIGLSTQRVHQLAAEGKIRFKLTPLGRLFSEEDVESLRRDREARKAKTA